MGRRPRISRAVRRNRNARPPFAIGLLLFPTSALQIFPLERADPRVVDLRPASSRRSRQESLALRSSRFERRRVAALSDAAAFFEAGRCDYGMELRPN